jgi:hypothetical protein
MNRKHFLNSLALFCFILFSTSSTYGQLKSYASTSGELIFSFARIEKDDANVESNLRWSPVFNWQGIMNFDLGKNFGFFYGAALRNVGFIYSINTDTLKKYRTYNFGIPVGVKLGKMAGNFIWGGYEFEMPFHYKEKTFVGERRADRFGVWFSNRVNWYTQSLFVGINFKGGLNLKFKYYLDNFFNQAFTENTGGQTIRPFKELNVNVFYIALDYNVFKDVKKSTSTPKRPVNDRQVRYHASIF